MIKTNIYTVAQVNTYIKDMFNRDYMLASLFIRGEVSNCKYHSSGHIYFSLKDQSGVLSCVMFASNKGGLDFTLKEGQQIVAFGSVEVYGRDGKYQLYAREIMLDGKGNLHEQFEKMKEELEEMGMFAPEYKQPIPKYIRKLGVVTAKTGAAIQDIIQIATRRNPYVEVILYPAIVQGEHAAQSIVRGIAKLEELKVDTIIVGRGGGSMEDLWAFNEKIVAQAIFDCTIPIISAVGHETDTTIADYVSDLRAPTPSAAAELAVFDLKHFYKQLGDYRATYEKCMNIKVDAYLRKLEYMKVRIEHGNPKNLIKEKKMYALQLEETLQNRMEQKLHQTKHRALLMIERLKGLSPLEKMEQGYSYLMTDEGKTIATVNGVSVGDLVQVHVIDGTLQAKITDIAKVERAGVK